MLRLRPSKKRTRNWPRPSSNARIAGGPLPRHWRRRWFARGVSTGHRIEGTIMRLALTVVSPDVQQTADVVLEADPATPVVQVAAELGRFMGSGWTAQAPPSIGAASRPGARVLRFPGPRSHGSLAMAAADPGEPLAIPL